MTYLDAVSELTGTSASLTAALDRCWPAPTDQPSRDDMLALTLLAHASPASDGHLIVVGAGHGRNAMALGATARATGHGRVFAVDLYPDADESAGGDGWSLDSLLRRVVAQDLTSWVLPHYGTAATFAQLMPNDFRCRLIHLEGAHACDNVGTDLFLLERLLAPGGWLTVGPGFGGGPGVRESLDVLSRQRPELSAWQWLTPGILATRKQH